MFGTSKYTPLTTPSRPKVPFHIHENEYRYRFNGQEQDNEITGTGNIMTAEFWMYDGRLGRRWNVDPVVKYFESTYACFSNNPMWLVDKDGKDTSFLDKTARKDFLGTYSSVKGAIAYNQKKIDDNERIARKKNWSSEALDKKNSDYKSRIGELNKIISMMDEIMKPNTPKIIYSTNDLQLKGKNKDGVTWQSGDNEASIVYPAGNQGCLIHESRHGLGFINKEWSGKDSYDYYDERVAFEMQMIWDKATVIQKIEESAKNVYPNDLIQQSNYNLEKFIIENYKLKPDNND